MCLIPNKELFNICGTNWDINDINEEILDKKTYNKYLTYPSDESNIFIVMKKPKDKVKNRLKKSIEEKLKNKKNNQYNKNNQKNKNNKNFIEIKNIKGKDIEEKNNNNNNYNYNNNNYNNHKFHILDNSKDKNKKIIKIIIIAL